MGNNITSFFGESLSDVVFARKVENENKSRSKIAEQIYNWSAYMNNEVREGYRDLYEKMLDNYGKIEEKDLLSFQRRIKDVVSWVWFNVFVAGDRDITTGNFSQSFESVAEFAGIDKLQFNVTNLEKQNNIYSELIKEIDNNNLKSVSYEGINYTKKDLQLMIQDNNEDIIRLLKNTQNKITGKTKQKTTKPDKPQQQNVTSVEKTVATDKEILERIGKNKRGVFDTSSTRDNDKQKALTAIRNLQTLTKEQSAASAFMQESDFGRVYVEKRANYIANTYKDDTRKRMENVFNVMKEDYEAGNASPIIQRYFEQGNIKKTNEGVMKIGKTVLKTTPEQNVQVGRKTYEIAGERIKPQAVPNNQLMKEVELYEDVLSKVGTSLPRTQIKVKGTTINMSPLAQARRIVETEVVAAYHMGRLHALYREGKRFVRWINSESHEKQNKVCLMCTTRALGTSKKLRDLKIKESLSGVYTLEEIMTDRQLAIPLHVHCACFIRPLTKDEEDILYGVSGLLSAEKVLSAAAVTAIGGAAVEGTNNETIAKEGTDRSNWWFGAAAVAGSVAVAFGYGAWYLRKSLTSKYAASLIKERGKSMVEKINKRGIILDPALGRKIPDEDVLNRSLKLTDVEGIDTPIPTPKYTSQEMKTYGVKQEPLPDLGKLKKDAEELNIPLPVLTKVDDNLEMVVVVRNVLGDVRRAKNAELPIRKPVLLGKLEELKNDVNIAQNVWGDVNIDDYPDDIKAWYKHLQVENNRLTDEINSTMQDIAQMKSVQRTVTTTDIDNINTRFSNLQPTAPSPKKKKIDIKQYFSDLEQKETQLSDLIEKLSEKQTITRPELNKIQNQISVIRREKTRINKVLSVNKESLLLNEAREIVISPDGNVRNRLSKELTYAVEKQDTVDYQLDWLTKRLDELKENSPTYGQKVIRGEVVDKFVGEVKPNRSPIKIKSLALNERKDTTKELDSIVNLLRGTRAISKDGEVTLANTLEEILKKLDLDENQLEVFGDNFVDIFVNELDRKGKLTIVNRLRSLLITETRRIRDAEFNRFQQKWAMFGSPR